MLDNDSSKIIIISGPSGSGKGTVISALPEIYKKTISFTTRAIRPDLEIDGVNYYFVDFEKFNQLIKDGDILECNYFDGNYYGTSRSQIIEIAKNGYHVILDVDVHGALNIKNEFPEALMIFLMSPNVFVQERRLRRREKNSEESIKNRIREAVNELKYTDFFNCIIINEEDKQNEAVNAILSFINEGISPDRKIAEEYISAYFENYMI